MFLQFSSCSIRTRETKLFPVQTLICLLASKVTMPESSAIGKTRVRRANMARAAAFCPVVAGFVESIFGLHVYVPKTGAARGRNIGVQ